VPLLLLDTSAYARVILVDLNGHIISEYASKSANKHVEELCSIVLQTLKQAKISFQELQHIFVIDFPGGYTSLRIGISFANALKFIIKKRITAISKFDIISGIRNYKLPYGIIFQNKLDEYVVKVFKDDIDGQISRVDKKEAIALKERYHLVGKADFLENIIDVDNQDYAEYVVKFLQNNSINVNNDYLKTSYYTYQKYTKMRSCYE
jgi:tRNA threonylcarbamoyl adenosine modification protein YeaZ